jgi:AcrR family transcriptional regulator
VADSSTGPVTERKSRGSRERILKTAIREFSNKGLSGARVDRIAQQSKTSKNMIYYHFGSKAGLYQEVMTLAYAGIRRNERTTVTDLSDPVAALGDIVAVSFDYHCRNEMFVRLVMSENINKGAHLHNVNEMKAENEVIIDILSRILKAGQKKGVFRRDIDPVRLHLTISGLGFHFVSNRFTFSKLFDIDMASKEAREQRRAEAVDIVLRWCKA